LTTIFGNVPFAKTSKPGGWDVKNIGHREILGRESQKEGRMLEKKK